MYYKLNLCSYFLKSHHGQRLDKSLSKLFNDYSRSKFKKWILNNKVKVNNNIVNVPKKKVFFGDKVLINVLIRNKILEPQNIQLNVIYEDEEILVINKQSNFVVHPGSGNLDRTLLNALLYHYPQLSKIPRAGIVHRLDKNTTGLMIIAKTFFSKNYLENCFKFKKILREYKAVVNGIIKKNEGIIDEPISRHLVKRTHMSINQKNGKHAITYYKVINRFNLCTYIKLNLGTGRTHQIRVHMAHIKHALIGDPKYKSPVNFSNKFLENSFKKVVNDFGRPALHSSKLCLVHPVSKIKMEWNIEIPEDMSILIKKLKKNF